jgi:NADH-quinone oxidoreductase subunit E
MTTGPDSLREQAREAVANQPYTTVTILSSLLAAQDALRYLPPEALDVVATHTGASINEVWGIASFYPNFRFTPPGDHVVEVCWGPTCHLMGSQPLLQGLLANLGLATEGETEDKAVTLKLNTCLGACPHAPVMSFDHHLAGPMDLETAEERLSQLRGDQAHN